MKTVKHHIFTLLALFAFTVIPGISSCGDSSGGPSGDLNIPDPDYVSAAYLVVPSGSVTYKGLDPKDDNEMTLTFNSDGTFSKIWTIPFMGTQTSTGTWAYDSNYVLTLDHNTLGATVATTEVYNLAFVYDDGNKLTFYIYKQTDPGDGSTILGTYSSHVNVHVIVSALSMNQYTDNAVTLTVNSSAKWNSEMTQVITGTPADLNGTEIINDSGTLAIPDDIWLFKIDSSYFIQVDDAYVLTKQP
jgi:hypothetical protein